MIESYHNGIPIYPDYKWRQPEEGVIDIHQNKIGADGKVDLRPLQIRSFRIDFEGEINKIPPQTPPVAKSMVEEAVSQEPTGTKKAVHLMRH